MRGYVYEILTIYSQLNSILSGYNNIWTIEIMTTINTGQLPSFDVIDKGYIRDKNQDKLNKFDYVGTSSIDISIREILYKSKDGKHILSNETYEIKPQESVYLLSNERLNIEPGFVAYVFLKNRFSQKGLLAFNTGITDGGFNGPLSTYVTNQSTRTLTLGEKNLKSFFRVVIHKIPHTKQENEGVKIRNYSYEAYKSYREQDMLYMPQEFLSEDSISNKVYAKFQKKIIQWVAMGFSSLVLLSFVSPAIVKLIERQFDNDQKESIRILENDVKNLSRELHLLKGKFNQPDNTNELKTDVKTLSRELYTLKGEFNKVETIKINTDNLKKINNN